MPYIYRKGYTLVEVMIVVAIIAVIMSIVLPNYLKSGKTTQKNVCINNLRQIDAAIEQWALEHQIRAGTVPSAEQQDEIYSYLKKGIPNCPSGGEYTINSVGSKPQVQCSKEDEEHKLPE